jgi:hypothetical protein
VVHFSLWGSLGTRVWKVCGLGAGVALISSAQLELTIHTLHMRSVEVMVHLLLVYRTGHSIHDGV